MTPPDEPRDTTSPDEPSDEPRDTTSPDEPSDEPPEVLSVVGTRPEIIKTAPVLKALEGAPLRSYLVHTGQHYDDELDGAFFRSLDLDPPDVNLAVGSGSQAEQTADALVGIERILDRREPAAVLAQGDTNAVLSAALAASKQPVAFAHVEAGLRSGDRTMPEETNRIVADRLADLAFAPTRENAHTLEREGITEGVFVTGNTVVDACRRHASLAAESSTVLADLGLEPGSYAVATIHRPRNTDSRERLARILTALGARPVVLPAHPRTRAAIESYGLDPPESLRIVDPLDYLDFLKLLDEARCVVTDSGGIQEEASVLEVPCLTVRPNTERPETVRAGVNELVEPDELRDRLRSLFVDDAVHRSMTGHPTLYGDGTAGERIVELLVSVLRGETPEDGVTSDTEDEAGEEVGNSADDGAGNGAEPFGPGNRGDR